MRGYYEDRKRQFWEMAVIAAIASGRYTIPNAVAGADAAVQELEKRWPKESEES